MKRRLARTVIALLLPLAAMAQPRIWQVPAVAHEVDFRADTSYVIASITIDAPDTGRVVVRFDGWAQSTPGDRIILGASDYPDWNTNDGNIGLYVFDEAHPINNFSHSRVYDVEPGVQTFYAVAQNYVDLDGTGIASIDGQLTVEYVPANHPDLLVERTTMKKEVFWDPVMQVIESVTIEVPSAGEVIVQLDGEVALVNEVENLYTISSSASWPQDGNVILARTNETNTDLPIVQRKRYPVTAGTHTYYVLGQRILGDPNYSDDYIYATLTARFVASGSDEVAIAQSAITPAQIDPAIPQRVGRVQLMTPANGTVSVQATGVLTSELNTLYSLYLVPADDENDVLDARVIEPLQADVTDTYFSLSAVEDVPAGMQVYDLMAGFADGTSGIDPATIAGLMTIQWVAEPVVSATEDFLPATVDCYPNPTSGSVRLSMPELSGRGSLTVFDAQGRMVRSGEVLDVQGFDVDLGMQAAGIYTIQVIAGDRQGVARVVRM